LNLATPSPLIQASYRLARAFGWTPQVVQALTMAQIAIYLELLDQETNG
jgi:hypothetical protein